MPALQAIGLTKHYPNKTALSNLNLNIEAGEIFCLLGANGAGKTTTISIFLGFVEPSQGQALIDGLDVTTHGADTKKRLAYIPENVMLYPHLTGVQNLAYFSGLSNKAYPDADLHALLRRAGLPEAAYDRPVGGYSKGMRQKVGIAIALAKQAKVLFLDEPTSGLDPLASNEFSMLLTALSQEGVAILMATHDLFRAKEVGHRIGIMRDGQLLRVLAATDVTHTELEDLYVQTIQQSLTA